MINGSLFYVLTMLLFKGIFLKINRKWGSTHRFQSDCNKIFVIKMHKFFSHLNSVQPQTILNSHDEKKLTEEINVHLLQNFIIFFQFKFTMKIKKSPKKKRKCHKQINNFYLDLVSIHLDKLVHLNN